MSGCVNVSGENESVNGSDCNVGENSDGNGTESWTWSESGTSSGETPLSTEQVSAPASDWLT